MRAGGAILGFRAAQILFVILPAILLCGSLTAHGVSYFFGDGYLDRFITSLGPGPVWSVLFPIVGLFALFLVWGNSLGPVFQVRLPPSSRMVVATLAPMLVAWVAATWLVVSFRTGVRCHQA